MLVGARNEMGKKLLSFFLTFPMSSVERKTFLFGYSPKERLEKTQVFYYLH